MQPDGSAQTPTRHCTQCGAENPLAALFCGNCGAQLQSSFERPEGPVSLTGETRETAPLPGQSAPAAPAPSSAANDWNTPLAGQTYIPAQQHQQPAAAPIAPPPPQARPSAPPPVNTPGAGLYDQQTQAGAAYSHVPYQPPQMQQNTVNEQVFYPQQVGTDVNTSGMGEGYPLPPQTNGWNFGGFVPLGLFGFLNGSPTWGAIGLVANFMSLYIVYAILIGVMGKQVAWKSRRFDSIQQFEDTMRAWNTWGLVFLAAMAVLIVIVIIMYIALIAATLSGELQ